MRRPVIVELVGPAGAGKTTLARRLCSDEPTGCIRLSLWGLPRRALLTSATRLVPTILGAAGNGRPLRWMEITQMIRLGALQQVVARTAQTQRIIVLDEGPVFALSSLDLSFARSSRDRAYTAWRERVVTEWATLLNRVVLLDASDPSLAHRIRSRAKEHFVKDKTDAEIFDFTAGFRRAFERVLGDLRTVSGLAPGTLDTEQLPLDRIADSLRLTLRQTARGN